MKGILIALALLAAIIVSTPAHAALIPCQHHLLVSAHYCAPRIIRH